MDQAPDQTTPSPAPAMEDAKKGTSYGSVLGIVLIVAVLVVGAFYVWGERLKQNEVMIPENGVRGDVPSEGTMPTGSAEGSIEIEAGGPQPE